MDELLTIDDVCRSLKLAKQTVYQLISQKKIPFIKISNRAVRFRSGDIQIWLDEKSRIPLKQVNQSRSVRRQSKKLKSGGPSSVSVKNMVEKIKRDVLGGGRFDNVL